MEEKSGVEASMNEGEMKDYVELVMKFKSVVVHPEL